MFKRLKLLSLLLLLVVSLTGLICVVKRGCHNPSISPYELATCCTVLRYRNELAGTGFFVRTKGPTNNTYLVTALHTIELIRERAGRDEFNIRAIVKRRDARGGVALTIPWDEAAFRPDGELFDLAFIRLTDDLLMRPDIDVTPVIFEYEAAYHHDQADAEPLTLVTSPWVYSASENIPGAIETAKKRTQHPHTPFARVGQPGFLLFPSRQKYGVSIGSEIFILVSQNYFSDDTPIEPFAIFLRTGVLAFCGTDGTDDGPAPPGESCQPFLIACQSSRGNSGAPVFANVKTPRFGGGACNTPHLLGVLHGSLNALGPTQTLAVAICDPAGTPVGKIQDTAIFNENAGLSVVWPVDYLARLLMEYEIGESRSASLRLFP